MGTVGSDGVLGETRHARLEADGESGRRLRHTRLFGFVGGRTVGGALHCVFTCLGLRCRGSGADLKSF